MWPGPWEEVVNLLAGLSLIAAPFIVGYGGEGQLRVWHFILGALVAALAALELWQDRKADGGNSTART